MATDTLDNDIYSLIAYYGFKRVHSRLVEIMKDEYSYLHSHFEAQQIHSNPVVLDDGIVPVVQSDIETKKVRKQRVKKERVKKEIVKKETVNKEKSVIEPVVSRYIPEIPFTSENQDTLEIKEVILVPPQDRTGFRDPKDVKEYQKKAEDAKRKENDALGIQIHTILTKENLKKWIEEEGRTYAWVAREKAGCADTQVAATAQMMGIKSKISRKRGMIMSGN